MAFEWLKKLFGGGKKAEEQPMEQAGEETVSEPAAMGEAPEGSSEQPEEKM